MSPGDFSSFILGLGIGAPIVRMIRHGMDRQSPS